MIEVPSWFLIVVSVAIFAAAHRRRPATAFLHEGDHGLTQTIPDREATISSKSDRL